MNEARNCLTQGTCIIISSPKQMFPKSTVALAQS